MNFYCFVCRRDFPESGHCHQCDLPLIGGSEVERKDCLHRVVVLLQRRYESDMRALSPAPIIRPEPEPYRLSTDPVFGRVLEVAPFAAGAVIACVSFVVNLFRVRSRVDAAEF